MKYIGNYPEQEIVHTWADRYDYVYASNPTVDFNPSIPNCNWLNSSTGEVFVCIDNTVGNNVWVGNEGTIIPSVKLKSEFSYDFISGISGGIILDELGNYDGTISGALSTGDGLYFNGSSDYIDTGFSLLDTNNFTIHSEGISLTYNSHCSICGIDQTDSGDDLALFYHKVADNSLNMLIGNANIKNPQHVPFSFNFTGVWDGSNFLLYIEDKLVASVSGSLNASGIPSGNLLIGCGYFAHVRADYFKGTLSKFSLFNYALTQAEVTALYNEGA